MNVNYDDLNYCIPLGMVLRLLCCVFPQLGSMSLCLCYLALGIVSVEEDNTHEIFVSSMSDRDFPLATPLLFQERCVSQLVLAKRVI